MTRKLQVVYCLRRGNAVSVTTDVVVVVKKINEILHKKHVHFVFFKIKYKIIGYWKVSMQLIKTYFIRFISQSLFSYP